MEENFLVDHGARSDLTKTGWIRTDKTEDNDCL